VTFGEEIAKEAETWIGTPYRYGCAYKKKGADCVRYIVAVLKKLKCIGRGYQPPPQHRDWIMGKEVDTTVFVREIKKFATEVDKNDRQMGDVVTFFYGGVESHMAFLVDNDCIVHAVSGRKVMKHPLKSFYKNIASVYRIKQ